MSENATHIPPETAPETAPDTVDVQVAQAAPAEAPPPEDDAPLEGDQGTGPGEEGSGPLGEGPGEDPPAEPVAEGSVPLGQGLQGGETEGPFGPTVEDGSGGFGVTSGPGLGDSANTPGVFGNTPGPGDFGAPGGQSSSGNTFATNPFATNPFGGAQAINPFTNPFSGPQAVSTFGGYQNATPFGGNTFNLQQSVTNDKAGEDRNHSRDVSDDPLPQRVEVTPNDNGILSGGDGNDILTSRAGFNILRGGPGNDVLIGGAANGNKTAVFNGPLSGYSITQWGNGAKVTDIAPAIGGNDGVDTLSGIEKLRFSDGDITVSMSGDEFRANSHNAGAQAYSSVAALSDGGLVVVWRSEDQDGDGTGIYGQRYEPHGWTVGTEFRINTTTAEGQITPSVTALSGGGFLVTWASDLQDGSSYGVYGQRYAPSGAAVGSEFRINTATQDTQDGPMAAAFSDGGFVVIWNSNLQDGGGFGVYGQRYDANGATVGSEFRVNTTTEYSQFISSVAALSGDGFVVTWTSVSQGATSWDVYGQRYDANGAAAGAEFRINTTTENVQYQSSVTALSGGGFVASWTSGDVDQNGIFAQRYDANGAVVGSEFRINTTTVEGQSDPSITAMSDGGFLVTWTSAYQDGDSNGVYGQRYDADGAANGSEFRVNTTTVDNQWHSSADALAEGGFVVTWSSNLQDGSSYGVYGQRFDNSGDPTGKLQVNAPDGVRGVTLIGGDGSEFISGNLGDNIIIGGKNADILQGSDGRNTFVYSEDDIGPAGDTIVDDTRTVSVIDYNGVALSNGTSSNLISYTAATALNTDVSNATVIGININGQTADSATELAAIISNLTGFSADANDVVLFIANKAVADCEIWRWADAPAAGGDGNGDVDVSEIEPIATFNDGLVAQMSADFFA